jgi:hypothetical protein
MEEMTDNYLRMTLSSEFNKYMIFIPFVIVVRRV